MTPSHEDPPADSGEYLVLSRGQWDADATPEAIQSAIDAFYPWLEAHIAAGRMKTGERLARAGATVSRKAVVVDGPYGETKELFNGFWILEVSSREEAAEWASRAPLGRGSYLEVRRVTGVEDFPADNEWIEKEAGWREEQAQRAQQ